MASPSDSRPQPDRPVFQDAFRQGFRREKTVSRSVKFFDRAADLVITWGGIAVILAVLGIMVFLISEVLPLFQGGKVLASHEYRLKMPESPVALVNLDEQKTIGLILSRDGGVRVFHVKTGATLAAPALELGGRTLTALAVTPDGRHLALGLDDGTIRFGEIRFVEETLPADRLPRGLRKLDALDATDGKTVYSSIPGGQYRQSAPAIALEDPVKVSEDGSALVALDLRVGGEAERQVKAFVALDAKGRLRLNRAESKLNLMTGQKRTQVFSSDLPDLPQGIKVAALLLSDKADKVLVAEAGGLIRRYNAQDFDSPFLAETVRVLPEGEKPTALELLFGGATLMVGGGKGSLFGYSLIERPNAGPKDNVTLVRSRRYRPGASAIVQIEASQRGKSFAAIEASGRIRIIHGTSQKELFDFKPEKGGRPYVLARLLPRMDGLWALDSSGVARLWEFSVPHPETTWQTLFGQVWYEGYPEKGYTWQSSAATDEFESKFSLIPLIFGTVKATTYSLLFAIPLAILGAVYTSEFLHPRVRAAVKPAMEMMASLPSVVLGFVAALVLAPVVETWISAVILAFLAVPLALILSAYLWQFLPSRLAVRLQGLPKFGLIFAVIAIQVYWAYRWSGVFERLFFGGDFKAWLNQDQGTGRPLIFLLLLPLSYLVVSFLLRNSFGAWFGDLLRRAGRTRAAALDLLRFVFLAAAAGLLSFGLAWLLARLGLDPRGGLVGTYVQRNTLVVGFAMGFAVIPIIYTIAEDALNAVPEHLRAASLGCGASPWQTAKWVVLPTALSGIFSAVMIGMGRAVGETMIVVMSAGNTPLMDWNVFNGLRALSATIAVELPEAVKGGTLYRVLFLAGLVLFAMTFVINTVAEMVRQRFRRRTLQL